MTWDVAHSFALRMSQVIGSQSASIRANIHVWMLFHDCLNDHVDDLFVLLLLLLLLGLPILGIFSCRLIRQLAKASACFAVLVAVVSANWQVQWQKSLLTALTSNTGLLYSMRTQSSTSAMAMCMYILFCRACCSFMRGRWFVFLVRILFRCVGILCCCRCDL